MTGKTNTATTNTTEKKRVKALDTVRIRSNPATSATSLGIADVGTLGTVRCDLVTQTCPATANGYTWWYIDWDNASLSSGWSVEGDEQSDFLSFSDPLPPKPLSITTVPLGPVNSIAIGSSLSIPVLVLGGKGETVTFSASGLVYGVEVEFSPATCTGPCVSAMTISVGDNASFCNSGTSCPMTISATVDGVKKKVSSANINILPKGSAGTWSSQIITGPITKSVQIIAISDSAIAGVGFTTDKKASTAQQCSLNPWSLQCAVGSNKITYDGNSQTRAGFVEGELFNGIKGSGPLNLFPLDSISVVPNLTYVNGKSITVSNVNGSDTAVINVPPKFGNIPTSTKTGKSKILTPYETGQAGFICPTDPGYPDPSKDPPKLELGARYFGRTAIGGWSVKPNAILQWVESLSDSGSPLSSIIDLPAPGTDPILVGEKCQGLDYTPDPALYEVNPDPDAYRTCTIGFKSFETPSNLEPGIRGLRVKNSDGTTSSWCKLKLNAPSGRPIMTGISQFSVQTKSGAWIDLYGNNFTATMPFKYKSYFLSNNDTNCVSLSCGSISGASEKALPFEFITSNHIRFKESDLPQSPINGSGPVGSYFIMFDPLTNPASVIISIVVFKVTPDPWPWGLGEFFVKLW
ncbi:MAG: hypothetical protein A2676_02870 [Candidatus Sungbacteria bacterium RIFCSPHIGHO2_01_FULL_51_22]|nr:MAG: hypothetical protein A2676_02870 [Candidatus Sungbacteria bacterium RIFCSPHIGHO2_01_FULL_51_22]